MDIEEEVEIIEDPDDERLEIIYANGELHKLNLAIYNSDEVKRKFEDLIGFKFKEQKPIVPQTIAFLKSWMDRFYFHHPHLLEIIQVGHALIAAEVAKEKKGVLMYTYEENEPVVIYREKGKEHVCLVSPMVFSAIIGNRNYRQKMFIEARLQGEWATEVSMEELNDALTDAIEKKEHNRATLFRYLIDGKKRPVN